jgi:hypothetical protein
MAGGLGLPALLAQRARTGALRSRDSARGHFRGILPKNLRFVTAEVTRRIPLDANYFHLVASGDYEVQEPRFWAAGCSPRTGW